MNLRSKAHPAMVRIAMGLQCVGYLAKFTFVAYVFFTASVNANEPCREPVGKITSIQGKVDIRDSGGNRRATQLNAQLCEGDTIRLGDRSRAALRLMNNAMLRIDQNTSVRLVNINGGTKQPSLIELIGGAIESFSHKPWLIRVTTPHFKSDVDGTEFYARVEEQRSLFIVLEGRVRVSNDKGQVSIGPGEAASAQTGKAPELRTVVRPRDAVQWALHYPPVLCPQPDVFPSAPDWQGRVRQSIEYYFKGDLHKAFESIASVPKSVHDPRFYDYRASLLLAVGRVDEANEDIARVLRLAPNDADALALRSIIAVAQNEKDKALDIAQRAVEAAPDSATALIALSYAQQARFSLEDAQASLEKAVNLDPENALAWARLAELWSSFGRLDQALEAAGKAAMLEPHLSRTQSVLGFAYLTRLETTLAQEAFGRAIALDQADPLPRLGLGLAKIREGDLYEGRREIETARSLDPNNAIVRSYLGKAYYEEKRLPLDEREYAVAKELDPTNPTPWFYDAIAKQTQNRSVEALHNLEKSIELNDNRAVYRSRLLLDSDLAARSASLGRIYSDLGFQQLALVEGWKSINNDPSNFSAHRLLADTYAVLPRHNIARVSELLQSQLLQPLNMTAVQPRLAESNLFLIRAQGPTELTFNEFNTLFERDGLTLQANSLAGEHNTYAGEGILSGIYGNASFSLGGYRFTTDGFRENAEQKDDIANAFVQLELSPQTSIQAEYRYRNTEHGDLQQRFFPQDFFSGLTDELESDTLRLGGKHAFFPNSMLLGSFIYQDADAHVRNNDFPEIGGFSDFKIPENAFSIELQHLSLSRNLKLQTGIGYSDVDRKRDVTFGFPAPDPFEIRSVNDQEFQHINAYAYAPINLLKNVTVTPGLSVDSLSGDEDVDTDQVSPKFGITWAPLSGTIVRAALFRTLKRTLINDQTLEPTQVAGFNQFFDDANLTEAWRYAGAIDQKFTQQLFAGAEVSKRDLTVPFSDQSLVSQEAHWEEYSGRAYLFWTPYQRLALRAQYSFERFDRDERFAAGILKLDTHRILLGIRWFDPSGISASVTPTYWNQNGTLEGFFDDTAVLSGRDDFWTIDAAFSYRLPKRYGFISAGVTNLLDEEFMYFETDENNPAIQPVRTFFVRLTLAFP